MWARFGLSEPSITIGAQSPSWATARPRDRDSFWVVISRINRVASLTAGAIFLALLIVYSVFLISAVSGGMVAEREKNKFHMPHVDPCYMAPHDQTLCPPAPHGPRLRRFPPCPPWCHFPHDTSPNWPKGG